jgi:rRNA maturation endonuclease Nob1
MTAKEIRRKILKPEHRCVLCNKLEKDFDKKICDICYKRISKRKVGG